MSLNLGSTLSPEDIKEGDDVYFECHIRANPPWSKLTWIHDVRMISSINIPRNQRRCLVAFPTIIAAGILRRIHDVIIR